MTTPTALPAVEAPVYRSRREAREARLAASAWEATLESTDVHTNRPDRGGVPADIDDLAGGSVISRTARRKFREAEQRNEGNTYVDEAPKRRSRYTTFPVAASLSLMLCFPGLTFAVAVGVDLTTPAPASSYITSASSPLTVESVVAVPVPSATPSPSVPAPVEAPQPAPVAPAAPVPMTSGDIPVAAKVAYGQSYGTVTVDRFAEECPRDFLEGGSKAPQMDPIIHLLDECNERPWHPVAHYPSTARPGAKGLVGLTGHRGVGELSPFTRIHELEVGDTVTIDTAEGSYVYSMLWHQEGINPLAKDANEILVNPVYRTADKTGEPIERALIITTCGLKPNGDGDRSVRVATYFEFKSFTPKA